MKIRRFISFYDYSRGSVYNESPLPDIILRLATYTLISNCHYLQRKMEIFRREFLSLNSLKRQLNLSSGFRSAISGENENFVHQKLATRTRVAELFAGTF